MSSWQKILGWLKDHERPISAGVALSSLAIALLASAASVVQAGLLMSQVSTPYRTALYVRQLEVASEFHAAAHEQWAAIIDLREQCRVAVSLGGGGPGDLWELSERFREGSTKLHEAYSATISTFPGLLHSRAREVWTYNETLVERVLTPARDCREFVEYYDRRNGRATAEQINDQAGVVMNRMREQLSVDTWSRVDRDLAQRWTSEDRERAEERERRQRAPQAPPTLESQDDKPP